MKVVGACSLENKTVMKDFYFEEGTSEKEISEAVDLWVEDLVHSWYVICNTDGGYKYGE